MRSRISKFLLSDFWGQKPAYRQKRRTRSNNAQLAMQDNPATKTRTIRRTEVEVITLLRTAPDIGQWRSALMMAESKERPDRRMLYATYKEILLDAHLRSVTDRILFKCTNHAIRFYRDGRVEENDEVNALCSKPWFFDLVRYIIESRWYGHSLIACNFLLEKYRDSDEGVELVPRQNVRPEFQDVVKQQGDYNDTILYKKAPWSNFLIDVGHATDLGLLNVVTPNVLYKRYGVKDWAEFLEVYGMPIREIEYDPNVPNARQEAKQALEDQGSNAGVINPIGSSFKLHDSAKAGNSDAFNTNAAFHNKEISKAFLLQTMTTEDGSSRSQADVHLEAEKEAIEAYRLFVTMVLNYKLKPLLEKAGFNVDGKFMYDDRPQISKVAMADLLVKLQSIADIPMSWVYDTFGIPAPQSGDDIKDNPAARSHMESGTANDENKVERKTLNLPDYPSGTQRVQLALQEGALTNQEAQLLEKIYTEQQRTGTINRQYFSALASQLTDGVNEGAGRLAADFDSPDHLYRSLMEANVQRFSAAKSLALVQQLNDIKNEASSFNDFRERASTILGNYNANWMRTEYNHAVAYAQNGAAFVRQQQLADDYPFWEYQTVGDDRVRASHAALDGRLFRLDDPEAARVYPPNGFGCRCEAIPRSSGQASNLSEAIGELGEDWDSMVQRGFDRSPATGEVFRRSMEYINGFQPADLTYKAYGLRSALTQRGLPKMQEEAQNTADWLKARRGQNGLDSDSSIRLTDYRQRPILMDDNAAEAADARGQSFLLQYVEDTLNSPDEVWLTQSNDYYVRRVLKFFQGKAMVLSVTFGDNLPEAIAQISLTDAPDLVREGILSYQKRN